MRVIRYIVLAVIACNAVVCAAQPSPPSFCFVVADDVVHERPLRNRLRVVQHYRERVPYVGANGTWLKPVDTLAMQGARAFRDTTLGWTVYHPVEGMAESYVLVMRGEDTMRVDLPEDPKPLMLRAWERASRETPEVIRFRKGHFAVEELVADQWAGTAARSLAEQLIAEDEAAYKEQLAALEQYYREQPPPVAPAPPRTPPPPMTEQDWEVFWSQQPPLKKVKLDRVNADTVRVRLTGRVMLNGGCGSGMPLFGVELLTDTGWVDRIPFEMIQMDCGMPWADWEDHVVMLPPLRWWIASHQPEGSKEMRAGSYRIFFVGGDLKRRWTEAFVVE